MSKAEILEELDRLDRRDRREILERICELEEGELLRGGQPSPEERALLDREWEDYCRFPTAGAPWAEVERRLVAPART